MKAPLVDGQSPLTPLGGYRSYADVVRAIEDYGSLGFRRQVAGRSVENKPIYTLELGPPDAEDVSVLVAGLHALEWIGVETGLAVAAQLLQSPPIDRRIILFPLVNVDGYRMVEDDLREGRRRFRRGNARGVDLNRNFPTFFQRQSLASRVAPWAWSPGEHALSEPEAAAVSDCLESVTSSGARVTHALSLHSFGLKVLFPYGAKWKGPRDVAALRRSAKALCARIRTPYQPIQTSHWVPGSFAHGMEVDHLHARFGATALLVECSSGGSSPLRPTSFLSPFRWFNPPEPARVAAELTPALSWFLRGEQGL